jgi:predicted MFS family arabinose efflux permease
VDDQSPNQLMTDAAGSNGPSAESSPPADGPWSEAHASVSHVGVLLALALGTFAVGTEGFMIAAILPAISSSLSVGVPAAGQLVTAFTLVYAVSSPLLTAMTAAHGRKGLLLTSLAAFVLANLLATAAPSYWALMGARVLLAISAGLYVPNAMALAGTLVHPSRRGRALAIVNGGITIAVALGVPAGAFVGAQLGWRWTFLGVALLSVFALLVLAIRLPRNVAGSPAASLLERLAIIRQPDALSVLVTTAIWATGAYTVYTYVSPFLSASTGLSPEHAGMMITLVGVAAVMGVALGGIADDRYGARRVQSVTLPLMACAFAGLTLVAVTLAPTPLSDVVPLLILWGLSAWGFFPAQQHRVITVVGTAHAAVGLSLNASFMYAGFALGAALGSLVISVASVLWIGAAGSACVAAAAVLSHLIWLRHIEPARRPSAA